MSALTTGIILPLYLYPSNGAANWKPAFNAILSNSNIHPSSTGKPNNNDPNYITSISKLNSYSNATYSQANIAIYSIFFDKYSSANFNYLNQAIIFVCRAFSNSITTVYNFSAKAGAEFYTICNIVVAFKSCLNCPDGPLYIDQATLSNNIPSGYMTEGAIILSQFTGISADGRVANQALINEYVQTMKQNSLGWFYFASAGYDTLTALPATVRADAAPLAA
ncbi:hypothetical protein EDB80DRAFT_749554 [Ilyonectria destructans]|nr:hypothetical protein EDB80DRAFT_749554 [Ilyonectria destructans]